MEPFKIGTPLKFTHEQIKAAGLTRGVEFRPYVKPDGRLTISWTPDPEAEAEAKREAAAEELRAAARVDKLSRAPAALQPIIQLHSPSEYGECQGCDGGPDYSGDWPCRTIELIQEGL